MKLKSIHKVFSLILFAINVIAMFFLLLSSFSDRISPESMMVFAYLGLAFPFILFANILFAVWWILVRRWKFLQIGRAHV